MTEAVVPSLETCWGSWLTTVPDAPWRRRGDCWKEVSNVVLLVDAVEIPTVTRVMRVNKTGTARTSSQGALLRDWPTMRGCTG